MSQENVEIVRGCFDAWRRWEFDDITSFYAADAVIFSPTSELFGGTYRGHEGLRTYFQDFVAAFEPPGMELERIVDADEQGVVCVVRLRAQGAQSGAGIRYHTASVFTIREGLIRQERIYMDPAEALEAVGLRE